MTSIQEPTLRQALHDLVDVPEPVDLADQALTRARRLRGRRTAMAVAAGLAVLGVLSLPFVIRPASRSGTDQSAAGSNATSPATAIQPCVPTPTLSTDRNGVAGTDWPQFVRIAIGKLPPRADYTMQYGWGVCTENRIPSAYAVINVGPQPRRTDHLRGLKRA